MTVAFIYKPLACHNYNTITIHNKDINIATIDTILSFYLGFTYVKMPRFKRERLLCMADFLFEIEQHNRLSRRGILKRFSIQCYGEQETLETIRAKKSEMFKKLRKNPHSKEYEMYFLKYIPDRYKSKTPTTNLLVSPSEVNNEREVDDIAEHVEHVERVEDIVKEPSKKKQTSPAMKEADEEELTESEVPGFFSRLFMPSSSSSSKSSRKTIKKRPVQSPRDEYLI